MKISADVLPDILCHIERWDLDAVEISARQLNYVVTNFMTQDCLRPLSHAHWNTEKAVVQATDEREVQLKGLAEDTVDFLVGAIASSTLRAFNVEDVIFDSALFDLLSTIAATELILSFASVDVLNIDECKLFHSYITDDFLAECSRKDVMVIHVFSEPQDHKPYAATDDGVMRFCTAHDEDNVPDLRVISAKYFSLSPMFYWRFLQKCEEGMMANRLQLNVSPVFMQEQFLGEYEPYLDDHVDLVGSVFRVGKHLLRTNFVYDTVNIDTEYE